MRQGEDFGGVGEWHGTLAGGVKGGEQEDEECNQGRAGGALVEQSEQAGGKESPHHLRESKQQEGSTAKSVDGPEGREGKEPVDQPETETAQHGLELAIAGLLKDGGAVEGDDVDSAHLLGDHDRESGQSSTAHARDGEEFDEALGVVGVGKQLMLDLELRVDVEHVAGYLDRVVAQLDHRIPSLWVAVLLHVPAGRFGADVDEKQQRDGGNEWGAEHEAPVDVVAGFKHG